VKKKTHKDHLLVHFSLFSTLDRFKRNIQGLFKEGHPSKILGKK